LLHVIKILHFNYEDIELVKLNYHNKLSIN